MSTSDAFRIRTRISGLDILQFSVFSTRDQQVQKHISFSSLLLQNETEDQRRDPTGTFSALLVDPRMNHFIGTAQDKTIVIRILLLVHINIQRADHALNRFHGKQLLWMRTCGQSLSPGKKKLFQIFSFIFSVFRQKICLRYPANPQAITFDLRKGDNHYVQQEQ